MAGGKEAASGPAPTKAEQDVEFRRGVQAIKDKNFATVCDPNLLAMF